MPASKTMLKLGVGVNAKSAATYTADVRNAITGMIQISVTATSGSGSRSIWSVRGSIDGTYYYALPTALTVTAGTISDVIDLTGYISIQVSNDTANGGTLSTYGTTETVSVLLSIQN